MFSTITPTISRAYGFSTLTVRRRLVFWNTWGGEKFVGSTSGDCELAEARDWGARRRREVRSTAPRWMRERMMGPANWSQAG